MAMTMNNTGPIEVMGIGLNLQRRECKPRCASNRITRSRDSGATAPHRFLVLGALPISAPVHRHRSSHHQPHDAFEPADYLPPGGCPPVALPPADADYRLPPLAPAADYGPAAIVVPDEPGSAPGFAAGHWRSAGACQIGAVLSVGSKLRPLLEALARRSMRTGCGSAMSMDAASKDGRRRLNWCSPG
jgi:hypothetical protein